MNIPGIPAGHVDVNVKISSNVDSNALSVLNNTADVFDWADTIPGSLLPQISSKASDRFSKKTDFELDVLRVHEHQGQAVLEPAGAGGRGHRAQPERDEPARLGHAAAGVLLPAART